MPRTFYFITTWSYSLSSCSRLSTCWLLNSAESRNLGTSQERSALEIQGGVLCVKKNKIDPPQKFIVHMYQIVHTGKQQQQHILIHSEAESGNHRGNKSSCYCTRYLLSSCQNHDRLGGVSWKWLDNRADSPLMPLSKQWPCKNTHFRVRGQIKCLKTKYTGYTFNFEKTWFWKAGIWEKAAGSVSKTVSRGDCNQRERSQGFVLKSDSSQNTRLIAATRNVNLCTLLLL